MESTKEYVVIFTSRMLGEEVEYSFLAKGVAEQEVADLISNGFSDARIDTRTLH